MVPLFARNDNFKLRRALPREFLEKSLVTLR